MDDLLLASLSHASSLEERNCLLKLLALKGYVVIKEKFQFAQTKFQYLWHQISEQWLHLNPDKLCGILSFPQTQTKYQMWVFLKLVGYC